MKIKGALLLLLLLVSAAKVSYGQIEYPEDKVSWKVTVEQNGEDAYIVGTITMVEHSEKDFTINGSFSFQTCDDDHCLPPHSADFTVNVKGVEPKEEVPEDLFENAKGDEVTDAEGNVFVKVNDKWHQVPEGNSKEFYKKYVELAGRDEK